jgi:oligopeptide transport system permease protein
VKLLLASFFLLLLWAFLSAALPFFIPQISSGDLSQALAAPSVQHILGCDAQGRDMLLRIGSGLGLSLWVGLWASVVAMIIGTLYGSFSALIGGCSDRLMMRIVEIINALPLVLFVVLVGLYVGRSLVALFVAIGAIEWTTLSRMVRARLLKVRGRDFVLAARTMGASRARILFRHLIPHTFGVVLAYTMLNLPAILILEATLSYLGLGVQPPQASLGVLLK